MSAIPRFASDVVADENANAIHNAKAAPVTSRRALGDISNVASKQQTTTKAPAQAAQKLNLVPESQLPVLRREEVQDDDNIIKDIDYGLETDPVNVTEYVNDIYQHYRDTEAKWLPKPNFMAHQTELNPKMRSVLIDWLVDVHKKFRFMSETLYLTINILDRYVERTKVERLKYQLVGITSMILAAKYEEMYAPELRQYIHMCDKTFSREQILRMEQDILRVLEFNLTVPTTLTFLKRFMIAANGDSKCQLLGRYFLESTLLDDRMVKHLPSHLAAASTCLCLKTLNPELKWNATLQHYTRYTEQQLRPCMKEILEIVKVQHSAASSNICAVKNKYSHVRFQEVAKLKFSEVDL